MAKQTGPKSGVKGGLRCSPRKSRYNTRARRSSCVVVSITLFALAGCGDGPWYSSHRDSSARNADFAACNNDAQDAVLARSGQQRATYDSGMPTPQPGNPIPTGQPTLGLGETPMQLHQRVAREDQFDNSVADCMRDKGYTPNKP